MSTPASDSLATPPGITSHPCLLTASQLTPLSTGYNKLDTDRTENTGSPILLLLRVYSLQRKVVYRAGTKQWLSSLVIMSQYL
jgi:hypothetical protein